MLPLAGENPVFLSNELAKIENDIAVCFMDKRIRIVDLRKISR
jgi:hypothetical protein